VVGMLFSLKSFGALGGATLLTVVTRLVILVAGLITTVLTARLLGPEGRGLYFYALTVAGFISQFGSLGFPSSNTYFVARQPNNLGPLAANSACLSVLVFIVAGLIVALTTHPGQGSQLFMFLAVLLGAASLFFMLFSNLLVGMQRFVAFNLLQLGYSLLVVPAILLAAWLSGAPEMFLIGSIVVNLLFCFISAIVVCKRQPITFRPRLDVFRLSANYSVRAFLITLIGYGISRANVLFLGSWVGHDEIGFYSVAIQIYDVFSILSTSIALVVFPRFIRQQEGRYRETLRLARLVAMLGLLACLAAAVFVEPFVRLAFGEDFLPSVPAVYAILPGSLFLGIATIVSQYMAASGMPWLTLFPWIAAAITLIASAGYLIPSDQATGAAGALSISYAVLLFAMLLVAARQNRLSLQESCHFEGQL